MKNATAILLLCLAVFDVNIAHTQGVEITGTVTNANKEYILLMHAPRFRGNLNFDGYKSVGSYIDSAGYFSLHSAKITDVAIYGLQFINSGIIFTLFKEDSLNFKF